jgi:type IV secretion system protein VirB4
MLNLAEYRQRPALLADWLPWAGLVAPGVVLNKDGSFQRTARFRGPDLDSATQGELIATTARLNNALRRLGTGWALFVKPSGRGGSYPVRFSGHCLAGGQSGAPPLRRRATSRRVPLALLYCRGGARRGPALRASGAEGVDWRERLGAFVAETERFLAARWCVAGLGWLATARC